MDLTLKSNNPGLKGGGFTFDQDARLAYPKHIFFAVRSSEGECYFSATAFHTISPTYLGRFVLRSPDCLLGTGKRGHISHRPGDNFHLPGETPVYPSEYSDGHPPREVDYL